MISEDGPAIPPHIERLIVERNQNADRLNKLTAFFSTPLFASLPTEEQVDMRQQQTLMVDLNAILTRRLERTGYGHLAVL